MARRKTTAREARAIGSLLAILLVLGLLAKIIEGTTAFLGQFDRETYIGFAAVAGGIVVVVLIFRSLIEKNRVRESIRATEEKRTSRYQELFDRYQNDETVRMIMEHLVWMGMTKEQLQDSLGPPDATGREVLKTLIREEYKYGRVGKNRFLRRIKIENGLVVSWSKK